LFSARSALFSSSRAWILAPLAALDDSPEGLETEGEWENCGKLWKLSILAQSEEM